MGRNSDTRNLTAAKFNSQALARSSSKKRARRNNIKRIVLISIIVILAVLVVTAGIIALADYIKTHAGSDEQPADTTVETTSADDNPHLHGASYTIDGDDSTYMLSADNQAVGAYLLISLPTESKIREVSVVSNDATRYLRSADIQISSDNENWNNFGELAGIPSHSDPIIVSPGKDLSASYIRIVLTAKADYPWLINTVTIKDGEGNTIDVRDASQGVISSGTVITRAPDATTALPSGLTPVYKINSELYAGDLILVNNDHKYQQPASNADVLPMYGNRTVFKAGSEIVYSYKIAEFETCLLRANTLKQFNAMCDAFYNETGLSVLHVVANGGYRSFDTQANLHAKYPSSASEAGYSEHNTGLSVNINLSIDGKSYALSETLSPICTQALVWLNQNAYKYGFIERYPVTKDSITGMSIDRYHYRYVGYPHAYYMTQNNLCLEEYLELVRKYPYSGNHLFVTGDDGNSYEIYYVKATLDSATTTIYVPTGLPYTVSGDNISGYIVTVTK